MKPSRSIFILLIMAILLLACSRPTPPPGGDRPPLATPDVPPLEEVDAAIARWEGSNTQRYFAEVEEKKIGELYKVRLVVAGDQLRAAQRLEMDADGNWGEPVALGDEEANSYRVDSILERVRQDVLGAGPAPFNMRVTFDSGLGFPNVVVADALPTYTEDGRISLNRQHGYTISMNVKALLEDSFAAGRQPILALTRGGGQQARCDSLRLFPDGSSVYADDCRGKMLQLRLPANRIEQIDALRASFADLEDLRREEGEELSLAIAGSGAGSPDAATLQSAWDLAATIHELLSRPVGLGQTIIFAQGGRLFGYDVFNQAVQPAQIRPRGELRAAIISPDQKYLAFSDDSGLSVFDIQTAEIFLVLDPPESGAYHPRLWTDAGNIVFTHVPALDSDLPGWGWAAIEQKTWNDLPVPPELSGYGCDTGLAHSPAAPLVAITGLDYGAPCNLGTGLTVVDLADNLAQRIVAVPVNAGVEAGDSVIAGGHTPAWSPDGQWIAFGLDENAGAPLTFPARLYRVRPDGSDLTPLTNNTEGIAAFPAWGPDGKLYYGLSGAGVDADGIYRYDPGDNRHTLMIPGSELRPFGVSPDGEFLVYGQSGSLMSWGFLENQASQVATAEDGMPAVFVGWLATAGAGQPQP